MKTSRRRIDVNVEELDRVIDAAEDGAAEQGGRPDAQNHAACAGGTTGAKAEHGEDQLRAGTESTTLCRQLSAGTGAGRSGRTRAQRRQCIYGSGKSLRTARATQTGRPLPGMPRRKSVPAERTEDADPHRGTGAAESDRVRDGTAALQCLRPGVHRRRNPVGVGPEKYDTTAVAMIALLKYGTGMPFNRMERLEETTGDSVAGGHAVGVDGGRREVAQTRYWTS